MDDIATQDRYRQIFEEAPVSLIEEDFTDFFVLVNELKAQGVDDFAAYFEEHPHMVLELAGKVRVTDINDHSLHLWRIGSKEEAFFAINKIFDEETYPVFKQELVALAHGATYFKAEIFARTLWNERIHTLMQLKVFEPDSDGAIRALLSFLDLTERKRMEEALQISNRNLTRSNAELEQFAYVASHDLQEPLRMITSYAQLMSRRYQGQIDEKADKYLHYVIDGANRMNSLISDLLTLSRVGTQGKALQPTSLTEVFDEVLGDMKVTLKESGATVTRDDELPMVMADHSQLSQVMRNLIGNGIKFRGDAPPVVHVGVRRDNDEWVVSVRDNGIGIAKEHVGDIFAIFKRVYGRGDYPGSGIGLSLAKKIVERHDGHIWVESEPDVGSTFFFTLKVADTTEPAAARGTSA